MTQQHIDGARAHWRALIERTRLQAELQEQQAPAAKPAFINAVHAEDLEGASYVLPSSFDEKRLKEILYITTSELEPTETELREAQDAVTRAVADRATALITEAHPGAEVDVQYALWGVAGLRYYGQDREALYDAGIPALDLLEQSLASVDGGEIAARTILEYRESERDVQEQSAYYNSPEFEEEFARMEANEARDRVQEEAALDAAAADNETHGIATHEPGPEAGAADQDLRERRVAAETRAYERQLTAWQSRREAYTAENGYSPEEWNGVHHNARVDVATAETAQRETLENVGEAAEQNLATAYATLAGDVNEARHELNQANLFRRPAARRALADAESRYEKAFGITPGPVLGPEPPSQLIASALTAAYGSPEVQQHREAWMDAVEFVAELDASKPTMCSEVDRPKPPVAGTPEQEAAKDRAFAGRAAQNQRANATRVTTERSPSPSRGPEQ